MQLYFNKQDAIIFEKRTYENDYELRKMIRRLKIFSESLMTVKKFFDFRLIYFKNNAKALNKTKNFKVHGGKGTSIAEMKSRKLQ